MNREDFTRNVRKHIIGHLCKNGFSRHRAEQAANKELTERPISDLDIELACREMQAESIVCKFQLKVSDAGMNYSECVKCGATTNVYQNGDFAQMYEMEAEVEENCLAFGLDAILSELDKPNP